MFTLQRDNVVKLTDSLEKRDSYIAQGYKLIEKQPEEPAPAENGTDEGTPAADGGADEDNGAGTEPAPKPKGRK